MTGSSPAAHFVPSGLGATLGQAGGPPQPASVYLLDSAPHDWLFPRCSAVVHHGGAGTVNAGILAGGLGWRREMLSGIAAAGDDDDDGIDADADGINADADANADGIDADAVGNADADADADGIDAGHTGRCDRPAQSF